VFSVATLRLTVLESRQSGLQKVTKATKSLHQGFGIKAGAPFVCFVSFCYFGSRQIPSVFSVFSVADPAPPSPVSESKQCYPVHPV